MAYMDPLRPPEIPIQDLTGGGSSQTTSGNLFLPLAMDGDGIARSV
jgi:hypothetical protein